MNPSSPLPQGNLEKIKSLEYLLSQEQGVNIMLQAKLESQLSSAKKVCEALRKFGFHEPNCPKYIWDGWDQTESGTNYSVLSEDTKAICNCGFDEALSDARGSGLIP